MDQAVKRRKGLSEDDPIRRNGRTVFMFPFATSPDRIKGLSRTDGRSNAGAGLGLLRLAGLAPLGTILDNPVRQRPLKPDIVAGLLRLDPFVLQNLFAFSLELAVKIRVLHQIIGRGVWSVAHSLLVVVFEFMGM